MREKAKARAEFQVAVDALAQLQGEATAVRDVMEKRYLIGPLNLWVVQQGWSHLDVLTSRINAQESVIVQLEDENEKKRQEVITGMQERKVLENLRDRSKSRWQREQDQIETRAADELVVTRHSRHLQRARGSGSNQSWVGTV